MAAPTLAELAEWARVEQGVETGPLQLALDASVNRIRGLVGVAEPAQGDPDNFDDDWKLATLTLALHYFEDRAGLYPEPNILGLLTCYNPVGYADDDDTATATT